MKDIQDDRSTPRSTDTENMLVDLSDADLSTLSFAVTRNVPRAFRDAGIPILKISPEQLANAQKLETAEDSIHNGAAPYQGIVRHSQIDSRQAETPKPQPSPLSRSSAHHSKRVRAIPEIRQTSAVECGAACLAMLLNYYGRATGISEIQERCGVGRDGLSALAIVKTARLYGLRVRAATVKQKDARLVTLPAIVHWEFNHFVVVERWTPRRVDIIDPAVGRRRLTPDEFDEGFTGVVILLEPGEGFEQRSAQRALSLTSYIRSLLHLRSTVIQIIGASLLLQVLGLGIPLLTEVVVDHIIPARAINLLLLLGLGMILLIFSQAITAVLRAFLLIYLQTRIDVQLMLNFFEHLLDLPYRFFQVRLSGDLLSRVNSNGAIRELLTNQLVSTLLDGSAVFVYLAILILQSPVMAEATLAIGALQVGILLLTAPAIRRLTQQGLVAQGRTQGYMNEMLAGIATLKAAGAEQRALERWTNLFFDEMNVSIRRDYLSSLINALLTIFQLAAPLLLLCIGVIQVTNGELSVGTMLALNVLAAEFLTPLSSLASTGKDIQVVRAHFDRIADVIEARSEQDPRQAQFPPRLSGQIDVHEVSFQYSPEVPPALHDISVQIQAGQRIALVGKTGSGKSTLGKLLIGLMEPTKGSIRFDDIPLHRLNYREVRSQCGVVLQESFIFSGSIRENIALNNPEMAMVQIVDAAHLAAIHEEIVTLPMGYETFVAEGGSALSGGQRQRLALARALSNHPAILLLDEATSALDVTTEKLVEHNLQNLPCTQIIIAHRLSTIRNADLILVLDQGCLVERGTHASLLQNNSYYRQLINAQIENGDIEVA